MAQLALQTPVPAIFERPPNGPIRLGSELTGYGTDNLACHYLGVHYKVASVTEKSSLKGTLRIAMEDMSLMAIYFDVRHRSTTDVPRCDVFVTRPPCVTFSSLGTKKGTSSSQGRLLCHNLQYIVENLPRTFSMITTRGRFS
ncbi:MAG: DNA cytosine methyltransferase, partial [Candidatus Fonsibacter sp.]